MESAEPSRLRRVLELLAVFLWEARGDLVVLAGSGLIVAALWTVDWRIAAVVLGTALIGLGARL